MRASAGVAALFSLTWAFEARAAEPVRLEWVRLEGAGSCIDSAELEARVRRRLGNDPFDPRASRSIEGVARRAGGVWHAQIAVRAHPGDTNPPLRELESRADDCEALSNATVLAVALAIDPAAAFSDPPAKEPSPPPSPEPPKAPPPPPVVATSLGLAGRGDLSVALQAGLLPRPSFGVALGVAAVLDHRLELGLHASAFPEVQPSTDPSYAIGLAAIDLEVCFDALQSSRFDLRACGGPTAGILYAAVLSGNRTQPGERAMLAADVGFDAAFHFSHVLALELGLRGVAPVTRYHFILEGSDRALFDQSVVAGTAHAGLELRFGGP